MRPGFLHCVLLNVLERMMADLHHHVNPPAFVSHALSFHQAAAMYAANMIRFQYTKESKAKCRRECLEHLKASLAHKKEGSA